MQIQPRRVGVWVKSQQSAASACMDFWSEILRDWQKWCRRNARKANTALIPGDDCYILRFASSFIHQKQRTNWKYEINGVVRRLPKLSKQTFRSTVKTRVKISILSSLVFFKSVFPGYWVPFSFSVDLFGFAHSFIPHITQYIQSDLVARGVFPAFRVWKHLYCYCSKHIQFYPLCMWQSLEFPCFQYQRLL